MSPVRRLNQMLLVVSMFFLSIMMWAGTPAFWLWLAGRSSKVSSTTMGSLLMVLIGIPVTMVLIAKVLTRLDHRYTDGFGTKIAGAKSPARWLHSARGGTEEENPSMLDKVMILSIGLALLCVGIYFVGFSAGSQAPH
jgi:hypothetical protein